MKKNETLLNLRPAHEMEELMGPVPRGFLQYGIGLILLVLLMLVAATCFIPYPDTRTLTLQLQPNVRPAVLTAPGHGTVGRNALTDGAPVRRGDTLLTLHGSGGLTTLTAPCAGTLRLLSFCYEGEPVSPDQPLLEISPAGAAHAVATLQASAQNPLPETRSLSATWQGRTLHFSLHRTLTGPDGRPTRQLWISRERVRVSHALPLQAQTPDSRQTMFDKIFSRRLTLPAMP